MPKKYVKTAKNSKLGLLLTPPLEKYHKAGFSFAI